MEIVAEREVTVLRDGPVTVRKSALDLGRDGVSGVKLVISSTSDDPVRIELHEPVPGHLALADIQIHPQYWPGKWQKDASSHRLVFQHELNPGGSIETIYGVRLTPDELGPLLVEPTLARVEVQGDAVRLDRSARGQPADETPTAPEVETAAPEEGKEETEVSVEADAPPGIDDRERDRVDPGGAEATAGDDGDRFRYGEDRPTGDGPSGARGADDPDRQTGADGPATRAKLEALESAVGELTGYVETLGRRIEESAAPSGALEELRDRQAQQHETIAELTERIEAETERHGELTERLRDAEGDRAALRDRVASVEERREGLADRLRSESERRAELADRLRDAEAERATLRDRLQAAEDHRDELSARLRAEGDDRAALAERVNHLEDQLLELRDRYEYQLESLVDRVEELESAFSPEESRAIREVIAAERRWKRQRERRSRPARLTSTGDRR